MWIQLALCFILVVSIQSQCTTKGCGSSQSDLYHCDDLRQQIDRQTDVLLQEIRQEMAQTRPSECPVQAQNSTVPYNGEWKDCADVFKSGYKYGGIFWIKPETFSTPVKVYCDNNPVSGGWTVFQRRIDGTVDFNRSWAEYKNGFGTLDGEFWLGNEVLSAMTINRVFTLRISLWTFPGEYLYRDYKEFRIQSEAYNYKLLFDVNSGSGNLPDARDGFLYHHGQKFSTHDNDNDEWGGNCAAKYNSGFWFKSCFRVTLNGVYNSTESISTNHGIIWNPRFGYSKSMKHVEMKLRSTEF